MTFAPQNDWNFYSSKIYPYLQDQTLSRSPEEKVAAYTELFDMIQSARSTQCIDQSLEYERWQERFQLRQSMCNMYRKLDAWKHGKVNPINVD